MDSPIEIKIRWDGIATEINLNEEIGAKWEKWIWKRISIANGNGIYNNK